MLYGWAGTDLEIDLSRGKIERKEAERKLYETYLGGKGTNAKLLWDRVPPEVEPFSPDNLLIFGTGLLTGTSVPTANKIAISFRSPLKNLFSYSHLGGFFGAELKHAGYNTIIISGKSPTHVYLWINNDNVEIRDASHLWGKDTIETQRIIRGELKNDKVQILSIGPAGENKVYMASIEHGIGIENSASRGGVGAIMGDKNIKAIAVYGTKDIHIAKPSQFFELCEYVLKRSEALRSWWEEQYLVGKSSQYLANMAFFGNVDEMPYGLGFEAMGTDFADFLKKFRVRELGCYNCPQRCTQLISLPGVGYVPTKCQARFLFSFRSKVPGLAFTTKCHNLCVRHGLDYVSTGHSIALAIDLYQKGILTEADTEGMQLEWGNPELVFSLIEKIAWREGIGAILANGIYEAARQIGKGAEKHTYYVKKLELFIGNLYHSYTAFYTATCGEGDAHAGVWTTPPGASPEELETYIKEGWWVFPEEFKKYMGDALEVAYEGLANVTSYQENLKALTDLNGVCWFWAGFNPYPPIKLDTIVNLIPAATGMDIDETKAIKTTERVNSLLRALNVRLGLRRKDDTVPEKFFQEPPTPRQRQFGLQQLDRDKFNKVLDEYYELKGWNREGIPKKQRLEELGLDYVRQDLESRRILTNEDD